jgi:hypothetical protein
MKSAMQIVAFSGGCEVSGISALAEVLIEALDKGGHGMSALYVQMAYDTYIMRASENADREMLGISEMG